MNSNDRDWGYFGFIAVDLLEYGNSSGWAMWLSFIEEREMEQSAFAPFKAMLTRMEREGLILKTGEFIYPEGKKKAKHWGTAVWTAGTSLRGEYERTLAERLNKLPPDEEGLGGDHVWIGKDITKDNPVPIENWRSLVNRVIKHGELRVRFEYIDDGS